MRTRISRILVPMDFSPTSDEALAYARTLAQRVGASLLLVHVLEDPLLVHGLVPEAYITSAPALKTALLTEARAQLSERAHTGDVWDVVFGHGVSAIVDYATNRDVDLIVMGTHGRTGMAHLIIGSVAEGVVRTASCPVLTLKQTAVTAHKPETAVEVAARQPVKTASA